MIPTPNSGEAYPWLIVSHCVLEYPAMVLLHWQCFGDHWLKRNHKTSHFNLHSSFHEIHCLWFSNKFFFNLAYCSFPPPLSVRLNGLAERSDAPLKSCVSPLLDFFPTCLKKMTFWYYSPAVDWKWTVEVAMSKENTKKWGGGSRLLHCTIWKCIIFHW